MNVKRTGIVFSWALYDLANQFFALNVVSLYFVRWLTFEKHAPEIYYSISFACSSFAIALLSPLFGAFSDYTRRRRVFLILFTLLSVLFTVLIGATDSVVAGLIFFAVAYFGCQMGVVFYNSLLADIVSSGKVGLVSGVGRMFGYSGALLALVVIKPVVLKYGYHATFVPTGLLFLVFALPCMLFVKDTQSVPMRLPWRRFFTRAAMMETLRKLRRALWAGSGTQSALPFFLRATFWSLSAVNTVILFMAVYVTVVFGLSEEQIIHLVGFSTLFAIVGSIVSGAASDYFGQKRFLGAVFMLWIGCLLFGALLVDGRYYAVLGSVVGLALGAIWVVLRAFLIRITPPDRIGEAFGLFNCLGYLSGICGSIFWGLMLLMLKNLGAGAYRITLGMLSIFMFLGLVYLLRIPYERS
ncbi:MAG: MFS transporter [Candidatus Omnitrophica bacterium]|nr:MFS transporter [Candidatus Omnitrophota bacterium]